MAIWLDHTIVPSKDKEAGARFFARIMGLSYDGPKGHFAPVRVNDQLTMDFDNAEDYRSIHFAFHISEEEFDAILGRIKEDGVAYGSGPMSTDDMEINTRRGGRGFYFHSPDGHNLEVMTRS
jgi:catechol 2,3-dioxygenase-like lactoylglutathione lyase family enzyme